MLQALTKSENEVVKLKAQGYLEKEIADLRCVSIHTVKTQVKRAIQKASAKSSYHLIAKYAAVHPELFKTMIAVMFLSIQSIVMFGDYTDDYRKPTKQKTHKVYRTRVRRKN
ncbi:MAG: hypothetical protein CMC76_12235 [Flavobacteriaceae bacterium]|nr:hypothetical protein [Flavobacteriaceae bacterium]|tara:strand:+ start:3446 stop:3781 length:336 start_codon:yes stop_codon:yes gene_type:complete